MNPRPSVRPAGQAHQPLLAHHRRVAAVAVGVPRPGESYEQPSGDLPRAGRVVVEQHTMGGSGPALICAQSRDFDYAAFPGSLSTCTVVSSISR